MRWLYLYEWRGASGEQKEFFHLWKRNFAWSDGVKFAFYLLFQMEELCTKLAFGDLPLTHSSAGEKFHMHFCVSFLPHYAYFNFSKQLTEIFL